MIILLILKNILAGKLVCEKLTNIGARVIQVSNSQEAIVELKNNQFDMMLTEVDIGEIDGWRLSRFIRTGILSNNANLPIILITENYSEHIAQTTARMFDVSRVVSYTELALIDDVVQQTLKGINCLDELPRILVIEDAKYSTNLISDMLGKQFSIVLAEDGVTGIRQFQENNYDIVLLDIMLPDMSGAEVLNFIMGLNPHQVVIIMATQDTIGLAELLLTKGAADYIQKPFRAGQIRKICDIAIKREDFLIATQQLTLKSRALETEQLKYDSLSKHHYRILDNLSSIVIELTSAGRISFLNNAWYKLTGFLISESIGQPFSKFINEEHYQAKPCIQDAIHKVLVEELIHESLEFKLKQKNGMAIWCQINLSPHYDKNEQIIGVLATIDDISERKNAENRLQYVALYDSLTGIHNRYYFDAELYNATNMAQRNNIEHTLLYLDLDHFQIINSSQGHKKGDLVLIEIAKLLKERVRASDLLCRVGGDEFAILLINTNLNGAKKTAIEICKKIANLTFYFNDHIYKLSCSIGITVIDGKAKSSDIYLQQADIAMFAAKERGRNRVHIFSEADETTESLKQRIEWSQKLQQALVEDNVILHFQPIVDVITRQVECYEALVRLVIDGQLIPPDRFIPSLEKSGEMNFLDRYIINKALRLKQQYPFLTRVALNLSAQAFIDDSLFSYIKKKLIKYKIDPSTIIFELTESASLSNITATQRMIKGLNELGCHFSIDDFGTGFSTFAYLKQIPAQSVKIDGSFVKGMLQDRTDSILVKAINDTAHALGKETIAEFVEDEQTLTKLAELGVNYAQGYYISKPLSIKSIEKALKIKKLPWTLSS